MLKKIRIGILLVLAAFIAIGGVWAVKSVEFIPVSVVRFTAPNVYADIKAWISYNGEESGALSSYTAATYTGTTAKHKADDWIISGEALKLSEANPAIILTLEITNAGTLPLSVTVNPVQSLEGKYIKTGGLISAAEGTDVISNVLKDKKVTFKYIYTLLDKKTNFQSNFDFYVTLTA